MSQATSLNVLAIRDITDCCHSIKDSLPGLIVLDCLQLFLITFFTPAYVNPVHSAIHCEVFILIARKLLFIVDISSFTFLIFVHG